ncbi:uncharacterized protein BX663DRAFT_426137 [Cokeromyces recurvatus]|uniref:uncharacterized protein n=1 Tax=Cokeromyces recurvatus TaxID=90255 RepID=UPI002220112E|nr:uncharacterized protein BX663DRAFT_426137 [Cokeromyces recurvatus]KAI7907148.1 hypothetical protein BX663DRAFT_426137 [Cokeromyces recurvatus]
MNHSWLSSSSPIAVRRLSQAISDIVSGSSSSSTGSNCQSSNSHSFLPTDNLILTQQDQVDSSVSLNNKLSIEFENEAQMILRPNRIIRGTVHLKFRAEEVATVKVKEGGLENKIERIDQVITSYFDIVTKIWGIEPRPYLSSFWETIEIGEYEYPFALKFPNVNFPPSTDDLVGFSIRYIWSAHLDGPVYNPGLCSRDYIVPYRPIICASPSKQWIFKQIIFQSYKKRQPTLSLAHATATFPQQSFCPDELINFDLQVDCIQPNLVVASVDILLEKRYIGQLQLQHGLARKYKARKITGHTISSVTGNAGSVKIPVQFLLPTKLVSPSFQSRYLCIHYAIVLRIYFKKTKALTTHDVNSEKWSIPIGITNLPYSHLLNIPHLTSIESYLDSKESPVFFDPSLDEPPRRMSHDDDNDNDDLDLSNSFSISPTTPSPPNYFSLTTGIVPSQFIQKERKERTRFTSRLIKAGMETQLGEPIKVLSLTENSDFYIW